MIRISQFWLDRLAGKPLSWRWARKDAEIARTDLALLDELSPAAWMCLGDREQRWLLRAAVVVEV